MHSKYSSLLQVCYINSEIGGKTKTFTLCLIKQHAARLEVTLVPRILKLGIKNGTGRKSVSTA